MADPEAVWILRFGKLSEAVLCLQTAMEADFLQLEAAFFQVELGRHLLEAAFAR